MDKENFITLTGATIYIIWLITTTNKFNLNIWEYFSLTFYSWIIVVAFWIVIVLIICPKMNKKEESKNE